MLRAVAGFTVVISLLGWSCQATELEDVIEKTLRKAIVKIDVSSNQPVFENGRNICLSEGTGFLITARHVVTAAHVFDLSPKCGTPVILIKVKSETLQLLASVVGSSDDVAILKVEQEFPQGMCTLSFKGNVFGTQAIRYGIPGGLNESPAAEHIRIGEEVSDFIPLAVMMGSPTEKGESGGPVINLFNVVGLIHGKHEQYVNFSFMTIGSVITSLLAKNSIGPSGHLCNPVEASTELLRPKFDPSPFGKNISQQGRIHASISLDSKFTQFGDVTSSDVLNNFAKQFQNQAFRVQQDDNKNTVVIERTFAPQEAAAFDQLASDVAQAAVKTTAQLQEKLWAAYVSDGTKSGKWSAASPPAFAVREEKICTAFGICTVKRIPYLQAPQKEQ